jgi:hypothetical protein
MKSALVLLSAAFACAVPAIAAENRPSPETVLRAAGAALGTDALPKIHTVRTIARGKIAGIAATVDSWIDISATTNAAYVDAGPLSGGSGYDGRDAWQEDAKGVVWPQGSRESRGAAINEAFRESYALWRPGHGGAAVELLARRTDEGRTYDVLRVTPPGGLPFELWIDAATHLPARIVETVITATTTTALSDYRRVNGLQIPYVVRQRSAGGGADVDLVTARAEANPAGATAALQKPRSHPNDFGIAGGSRETTVPFTLVDNHIYVDVRLNGKGPYHFELDTGGANFVDPAVLREIGGSVGGTMQGSGVGEATETSSFGTVASLRIGDAELHDQIFIVGPVRAGFGVASSAPVDGLIGFEVLARFLTTVDYERGRVTLRLPQSDPSPTPPPSGTTISFVFNGTQPQIACTMDGIPGDCTVDTGSRSSLDILTAFVAAHPSLAASATAPGVGGFGVGGPAYARLTRLATLGLGTLTLTDVVADLDTATKGFFADPYIASNIGGGVWKRFTVTFDYPNLRMTLVPNASFATRDDMERAGVFVVNGKDGVTVVGVREGTPAAQAGIVTGDTIVSLDGKTSPSLADVRAAFLQPSGTHVTLSVRGKSTSQPRSVALTLRDYI